MPQGARVYLSQSPTTRDRFVHFERLQPNRVKATENRYTVEGWKAFNFEGSADDFVDWLTERAE